MVAETFEWVKIHLKARRVTTMTCWAFYFMKAEIAHIPPKAIRLVAKIIDRNGRIRLIQHNNKVAIWYVFRIMVEDDKNRIELLHQHLGGHCPDAWHWEIEGHSVVWLLRRLLPYLSRNFAVANTCIQMQDECYLDYQAIDPVDATQQVIRGRYYRRVLNLNDRRHAQRRSDEGRRKME